MPVNQPLSVFKSNILYHLRSFFDSLDELKVFGPIRQYHFIIGSFVIISELIWFTKHIDKEGARTDLIESVQAETVILYGPEQLKTEFQENLIRIREEECIPLQDLSEK